MVLGCLQVAIHIPTSQQTPVDIGVQGLNTAFHHLRKTSHIVNSDSRYTSIIESNL
ncbi:Uncharacterised protein [Klebsiella pneumoniae]|nr:Uncharacterised protein [Klebsiella pneumoniae]